MDLLSVPKPKERKYKIRTGNSWVYIIGRPLNEYLAWHIRYEGETEYYVLDHLHSGHAIATFSSRKDVLICAADFMQHVTKKVLTMKDNTTARDKTLHAFQQHLLQYASCHRNLRRSYEMFDG